MIPMRTSSVFKSRWMALLWAAGIIWFAVDFAGSHQAPASSNNTQASSDDVNTAADALGM